MNLNRKRKMLMGIRGFMVPVPRVLSDKGLNRGVDSAKIKAARLSEDERLIHHHIVLAMATADRPIEAVRVSEELLLPLDIVREAIDKLEEMKTFLYRTDGRGIDWAYPLSLDDTGHEMRCSTGERFSAA